MEHNQHIWQTWAETLNRWGVKDLTATFLDVIGPFSLFGAQLVYLGQPFLTSFMPDEHLDALVNLLEKPKETKAFVSLLRQPDKSI